jgi:hypothetical protein
MEMDLMTVLSRKKDNQVNLALWLPVVILVFFLPLNKGIQGSQTMLCHFKVKHLQGVFFFSSPFTLEFIFISYPSAALSHFRVLNCNLFYNILI